MNSSLAHPLDTWPAWRTWGIALAGLTAVVVVVAAPGPIALAAIAGALCVLAFIVRFAAAVPALFLNGMTFLLAGYAVFGRSFAYVGVPPVYVGEAALALGLLTLLTTGAVVRLAVLPQTWILLALGFWGALQTLPYIDPYGIDALRDATVWGYGAFALAVAASVLASDRLPVLLDRYGRAAFWFAAWVVVGFAVTRFFGDSMPDMPGTDVPLLKMKMGDAGVHLAGVATFALIFSGAKAQRGRLTWLFWATWLIAFACVITQNRGGFVAVLAALAVIALLDPRGVGGRVAIGSAVAVVLAGLLLAAAFTVDPDVQLGSSEDGRVVSPRQMVANVASLVTQASDDTLVGTTEWRLEWWREIAQYTFNGPYFWTGKGFGINLSIDDGFVVAAEDNAPLRSPHDVHMTFLARAGVPGFVLWILLQSAFGIGLVRAYGRARRLGAASWARLDLWVLAYWVAFLVNASFDVYLEGPQGGIWFWSLFGVGLAALAAQRSLVIEPARGVVAR